MDDSHQRFGGFSIDKASGVVFAQGQMLPLRRRTARLLIALLEGGGNVITKDALMNSVWGHLAVEESNLSVQVATLRKALAVIPRGRQMITTIAGVGYRLVLPAEVFGESGQPPLDIRPGTAATDLYRRGRAMLRGLTRNLKLFTQTRDLFQQVVALAPEFAEGHAALSMAYAYASSNNWTDDPMAALSEARRLAEKAIATGPTRALPHVAAALVAMFANDPDRFDAEAAMAIALDPEEPEGRILRGYSLVFADQPRAAMEHFEAGMRLDPASAEIGLHHLGLANLLAAEDERAAALFCERIMLIPDTDMSRAYLASALGHLGQAAKSQEIWRELRRINPDYKIEERLSQLPFRTNLGPTRILQGLAHAKIAV